MKKIIFLTLILMLVIPLIRKTSVYAASENGIVQAGNKFCPVSGDEVTEQGGTVEYQGKSYKLCCPMCAGKFKKNPEKYLAQLKEKEEQVKS